MSDDTTMVTIILVVYLFSYFFPVVVAAARRCKHGVGILVLNLFFGWTFMGWVLALIWAVTDEPE